MYLKKIPICISLFLCIIGGYLLFDLKDKVMKFNRELDIIKQQIAYEHNAIKILKSEFVYLSSPERLENLANKYLTLDKAELTQLKDHVEPQIKEQTIASINKVIKPIKWRYKKNHHKYLIRTSHIKKNN